ncbi:hypothetical protein QTP88_014326 [Uroleucon formosanum]
MQRARGHSRQFKKSRTTSSDHAVLGTERAFSRLLNLFNIFIESLCLRLEMSYLTLDFLPVCKNVKYCCLYDKIDNECISKIYVLCESQIGISIEFPFRKSEFIDTCLELEADAHSGLLFKKNVMELWSLRREITQNYYCRGTQKYFTSVIITRKCINSIVIRTGG